MVLCIFSPSEAQKIARGEDQGGLFLDSLQHDICPALDPLSPALVQERFKEAVATSDSRAIAYLWRGVFVETIQVDQRPVLGPCEKMDTPERCEALLASYEGRLSIETAFEEESFLGARCIDLTGKAEKQDELWLAYFDRNKNFAKDPSQVLSRLHSDPESSKVFSELPKLSPSDLRLLGHLIMVSDFLFTKLQAFFSQDAQMIRSFCGNRIAYDCNMVSTRVLDLLRKVKAPHLERVEVVSIPSREASRQDHVTLRIKLEQGSWFYFNNGKEFLPSNAFEDYVLQIKPAWQIISDNWSDIGMAFVLERQHQGDLKPAERIYRAALRINPRDGIGHYGLGRLLLIRRDLEGAIREFKTALEINPKDLFVHVGLGRILEFMGDLEGATSEYKAALEINPDDESVRRELERVLPPKMESLDEEIPNQDVIDTLIAGMDTLFLFF